MIDTDTNPNVTTAQSNSSVDTGFGVSNTSNHTTTTTTSSTIASAVAATDGSDTVVALIDGTPELLFYNSSGGLDTSYGSGGIVSLSSWTTWTKVTGIVIQSNGYIDLSAQTSSGGLTVAQLNATGTAVSGFGTSGVATYSSLPVAQGLCLGANGELLAGGSILRAP